MENEKETVVEITEIESHDFDLSALTAKNSDYVHSVTRGLLLAGKSDEEVKTILADIIPQIVAAQKTGVTARNLLGTPTEFIEGYKPKEADKNQKYTNTDPKLMILDSILLLFSLLAGLYGIMMEFNKTGVYYGLTTLILSSIVGGLALYQVYRNQLEAAQKKEKQSFWKRSRPTLFLILYMLAWVVVTSVTAFLPAVINPLLNGVTMIILAVLVFGGRYLLKRRFKIVSAMTARPRTR
ncbi:MAG: DUF1129 domain-containing protein [Streptococcaceae bacterium]|jgi:uncharacterized membrane-anchored protein|nr:DUF1129 domain-containing protein [Streptococcaceae bacterium]